VAGNRPCSNNLETLQACAMPVWSLPTCRQNAAAGILSKQGATHPHPDCFQQGHLIPLLLPLLHWAGPTIHAGMPCVDLSRPLVSLAHPPAPVLM